MTMTGAEMIAAERTRQVEGEGYSESIDDLYVNNELVDAALSYADWRDGDPDHELWPWSQQTWKPKDRVSNLVRAGALIAAEIDRLKRLGGNS